jgi:hypothetical protein
MITGFSEIAQLLCLALRYHCFFQIEAHIEVLDLGPCEFIAGRKVLLSFHDGIKILHPFLYVKVKLRQLQMQMQGCGASVHLPATVL